MPSGASRRKKKLAKKQKPEGRLAKFVKPLYNHSKTGKALYGDIVLVLIGITCAFVFGWELYKIPHDDPVKYDAYKVYLSMIAPICFTVPAAITKNLWCSRMGLSMVVFFKAYSNLMEWPHPGECTISVMLPGSVAMGVLANVSLAFEEKIVRLFLIFVVGSYVSIQSPHSVYVEDALPILGGMVAVSAFGLYAYHYSAAPEKVGVHGARLVLSALFVHHTVVNFTSIPSTSDHAGMEQISGVLKAVVIACIGAMATGSFQKEIQHKEELEILVRQRTKEIQLQNKKLRMVSMALQASETAIAITDTVGTIVWLNTAFKTMCHNDCDDHTATPIQLLGKHLKDVICKLDPARKENRYLLIDTFEDSTKPNEGELLIGESIFRLEATPFPENGDDGDEETSAEGETTPNDRFLVVFKDITVGRAKELAEQKAHDEAMVAEAMGESMVTLTHELRTPLQGIMGVTSLLLQQASDLTTDILESLKLIMASSSLLLNLINNLLDVKKVTAKMMEDFPLSPISASSPIRDAVGFCLPLASISSVNIVTDLQTAQHAIVKSNALRLQQVLINMISNGIKYTERGTDICIRLRTMTLCEAKTMVHKALAHSEYDEDYYEDNDDKELPVLVFSVSDCGSGIAPNQAEKLFRQYARLDTKPIRTLGTNKVGQPTGTGLGLHLCQLFVERMHGQIWATNNANDRGSTFSFYLPLISNHTDDEGIPSALAAKRRLSNPRMRRVSLGRGNPVFDLNVLLVDDTLINRKVFDRMLKRMGVTKSKTVESGDEALKELSQNHYDLVITDLQMPEMSGTELSVAIQNRIEAPPVVVGLTADTGNGVAQKCRESGMADVLYKPITLVEMKEYFETTIPHLQPGVWYASATLEDIPFEEDNKLTTPAQ